MAGHTEDLRKWERLDPFVVEVYDRNRDAQEIVGGGGEVEPHLAGRFAGGLRHRNTSCLGPGNDEYGGVHIRRRWCWK